MLLAIVATHIPASRPSDRPTTHPHEEIELKWALSPAAHDALGRHLHGELGAGTRLDQTNFFFDTPDLRLRSARMNLRLRHEHLHGGGASRQRLLMTVKHKTGAAASGLVGGLARHQEWECELDPSLIAELHAPPAAWSNRLPLPEGARTAIGDATLRGLGGFANQRLEFHARRGDLHELLCLDATTFTAADGGTRLDHELEIETPAPALSAGYWSERLAQWHVAYRPQTLTKFARFLALG